MNDLKSLIKNIETMLIFQNSEDKNYNSSIIIFRNFENKPFLLYIEKIDALVSIDMEIVRSCYSNVVFPSQTATFKNIIRPVDNILFRIIDLSFEQDKIKDMTKVQIEEKLGYKINIL